jgi:hypothetical protein
LATEASVQVGRIQDSLQPDSPLAMTRLLLLISDLLKVVEELEVKLVDLAKPN